MGKETSDKDADFIPSQVAEYVKVEPRYRQLAIVLGSIMDQAAKTRAPLAIVQYRAKAVSSFAGKIHRKTLADPVRDFTDLCGVRVITHMPSESERIADFIERHFVIDRDNSVDISKHRKPAEFGYRSVHYIVQLKPGAFADAEFDVDVDDKALYPSKGCPMKAEIQVRTILEHAWADFNHDRLYKSPFEIPNVWQREVAELAAVLEGVDRTFERIRNGLATYEAHYGAYMSEDQIRQALLENESLLAYDEQNREVALKIAMLALELKDWARVDTVLMPFKDSSDVAVLRTLGVALCKANADTPDNAVFAEGRQYLERARAEKDVDAIASLAGTYKATDPAKAHALYEEAYLLDPTDPYPLLNLIQFEIVKAQGLSTTKLLKPVIQAAEDRCQQQIDVGINSPWAHYTLAFFQLVGNEVQDCVASYRRAIAASNADWMVETSFNTLEQLQSVQDQLEGYQEARKLFVDRLKL